MSRGQWRQVVHTLHWPIVVRAVDVDVGADRLVDRVARIGAEHDAAAEALAELDVGAGRERMHVVAIAAAVIEPRIAIDDDRGDIVALRESVADAPRPAVGMPLLEPELERIELGVERGASSVVWFWLNWTNVVPRASGGTSSPVGSNTSTPSRVTRPVAGLTGPSLMSMIAVLCF